MMSLTTGLRAAALSLAAAAMGSAAMAAPPSGQTTFMENCSACHQPTGVGIPGAFPALKGDKFVVGPPNLVIATVLNGRGGMPSFKSELSDVQIAGAISYVRSSWGNKGAAVTPAQVTAVRTNVKAAPVAKNLQAH